MNYPRSEKYQTPELLSKIMGPNPIKLEEELLLDCAIPQGSRVCDLGSGQGLTSVFLAKEYGFTVYAADLWSDPEENRLFFRRWGCGTIKSFPSRRTLRTFPLKKTFLMASLARIPITILAGIRLIWTRNCCPLLNPAAMCILPFPA